METETAAHDLSGLSARCRDDCDRYQRVIARVEEYAHFQAQLYILETYGYPKTEGEQTFNQSFAVNVGVRLLEQAAKQLKATSVEKKGG